MNRPVASPGRRYARDLGLALGGYAVLLVVALLLLRVVGGPARWLIVLLPVPALVAVVWAVVRNIRASDELQGRITTEAVAIGFALGSVITFSYGLLQLVGAPPLSWLWVWPVYAGSWLVGLVIAKRRY